jgi:hypothetical protein
MTILNDRDLKRHELMAGGLLAPVVILGAVAAAVRARGGWIPEYPQAMMAMAVVLLFSSLTWRVLAFGQALWRRAPMGNGYSRMLVYLAAYSLCVALGAGWLLFEKQRVPDLAWGRDQAASLLVLYAVLVILVPWVGAVVAQMIWGAAPNAANRASR